MGIATFGLVIDQPTVVAGSTLSGQVYADVQQEISGTSLTIEFYGQESTKVRYTTTHSETRSDGTSHSVTTTHYAYGNRQLIRVMVPTKQQLDFISDGKVRPGKYVIPFQVELSSSLPSSVYISNHDGYAKIEYQVKAILKGSGFFVDYHAEQIVTLLAAPPPPPPPLPSSTNNTDTGSAAAAAMLVPFNGEPSTSAVNFCCCFNRGSVTLGVWMDTTLLPKNNTAILSVASRNNSSVKVNDVCAQLVERITWYASGHRAYTSTVLTNLSLGPMLLQKGNMDIKSKDQIRQSQADPNYQLTERQMILEELKQGSNQQHVVVPIHTKTTYMGSLMKIQHDIRVWANLDGCCLSEPSVCIPITVLEPTTTSSTSAAIGATPAVDATILTPVNGVSTTNYQTIGTTGGGNVPVAVALPVEFSNPSLGEGEVVYTNVVSVESHQATLGGLATSAEEEIAVPATTTTTTGSVSTYNASKLLQELKASIAGEDLLDYNLKDPLWLPFLSQLSPTDYGSILQTIQLSLQQLSVAEKLAKIILSFVCEHVKCAVQNATSLNRTSMVETLLPYARDVTTSYTVIRSILTEWEVDVTQMTFAAALKKQQKQQQK